MNKEWLFKTVKLEKKSIDESTGEFSGYASLFDVPDAVNDIMVKGCFTKTIKEKGGKRVLLWQHDPKTPIGSGYHNQDEKGLKINGKLNLKTTMGQNTLALLVNEDMDGLSIGFNIEDGVKEPKARFIKEVDLWETSVVTFPCLDSARINEVKSFFLGVDREDKQKFVMVHDAIKYLDEYVSAFDETQIVGYKTDLEGIIAKSTALLLKAGLVKDPFAEKNKLEGESKALASILEDANKIKINFRKVFKDV